MKNLMVYNYMKWGQFLMKNLMVYNYMNMGTVSNEESTNFKLQDKWWQFLMNTEDSDDVSKGEN